MATCHPGNDAGNHWPRGPSDFGVKAVAVRGVVVTVIVVLLPAVTEGGLNIAVAPTGKPVAVNVTGPGKAPPTGAVAITNSAGWPAVAVCGPVVLVVVKSMMLNVSALDVPPPGAALNIVIEAEPAV